MEAIAVSVKERLTEIFRAQCDLAATFAEAGAARDLAALWGCSTTAVNRMAAIYDAFPEAAITPDVPLSLYGAALECDDPVAALEEAVAHGWSSRQLRDAHDIAKGRHKSRTLFRGRGRVKAWQADAGRVVVEGLPISGDAPDEADVAITPIIS
jgi:hypothetical protein